MASTSTSTEEPNLSVETSPSTLSQTVTLAVNEALKNVNSSLKTDAISTQETTPTESSSISTLLLGLDYIFYIWTFLLVTIVTYLSIYKYYQYYQLSRRRTGTFSANRGQNNGKSIHSKLFNLLKATVGFLYTILKNLILNQKSKTSRSSFFNRFSSHSSYTCLNNVLKWFYFNSETTKNINNTILNLLNSGNTNQKTSNLVSTFFKFYFKTAFFEN